MQKNTKSMDIYRRMYTKPSEIPRSEPGTPLLTKVTVPALPAPVWRALRRPAGFRPGLMP